MSCHIESKQQELFPLKDETNPNTMEIPIHDLCIFCLDDDPNDYHLIDNCYHYKTGLKMMENS